MIVNPMVFTTPVARPLPEWKLNGKEQTSMLEKSPLFSFSSLETLDSTNQMADGTIDSMLTVDLQYNYNFIF